MNITDFSLKLNGFPIEKAKLFLSELDSLTFTQLENQRLAQRDILVQHHLTHNSFYKSLVGDYKNWESLPVITKKDLQAPLESRLSRDYNLKNVYKNKTSGSSGDPFYFAKDKYSHALTWAVFHKWYNWFDLYNQKQARFYGIPKDPIPRFKERLKDYLANRYRFNVFDLSNDAFEQWIITFSKEKFAFITGYTTVIVAFAKYLKSKNIVLHTICPSLKACLPTSEMCFDSDRQIMREAFGIPIVNEYGASEFGLIAFENPQQQWVLNTMNLYVEILDEHNNILPYGKEGRIVITDLYNKAHPFIRYDIGDIGSIKKLEDGTLVLQNLIGRKEDYVQLPSGKTAPGLSFYYVTKSVMQDDGNVKEIKAIQTAIDSFEIQYVANNELSSSQMDAIKQALFDYLEPGVHVNFTRHEALTRSNRGKLKQFTSLL